VQLSVDGRSVFAATGGRDFDPALPTLVLVHGAGFDRTTWQLQTRYFAHHGFGVLAVDLPGHGRSQGPALDSVTALGDWLVALLSAVSVEEAVLVGHSLGALACLSAAARHPTRVTKLAMLGVAETMPVHPELLAAAERDDQHAIDLIIGWSFGAVSHRGGNPSPGTWMVGAGNRQQQRAAPGVLFNDLTACNGFGGAVALATQVSCPALYLLGDGDKMTPAKAAQPLIEATADATVVVLTGTGHMLPIERPIRVREILAEFLT
jgi:pimeloyl-ACP methyl ester carboxylesterase